MRVEATFPRLVCVRGGRKTNRAQLASFGCLNDFYAGLHASYAGNWQSLCCEKHIPIIEAEKPDAFQAPQAFKYSSQWASCGAKFPRVSFTKAISPSYSLSVKPPRIFWKRQ